MPFPKGGRSCFGAVTELKLPSVRDVRKGRQCSKCRLTKSLSEFSGKSRYCKPCQATYQTLMHVKRRLGVSDDEALKIIELGGVRNIGRAKLGDRFGRLVVTSRKPFLLHNRSAVECKCDCGEVITVMRQSLKSGGTRSCGCLFRDMIIKVSKNATERAQALVGRAFGKWTVVALAPRKAKNGGLYFRCRCECGGEHEVSSEGLVSGKTKSCGACSEFASICKNGHDVKVFGERTPTGACRGCIKEKGLMRNYGLTFSDFKRIWDAQGGKCPICGRELRFEITKPGFGFARVEIDHEHGVVDKRASVRGLLCGGRWAGCNRRLGNVDNVTWLSAALAYLQNPPARRALTA